MNNEIEIPEEVLVAMRRFINICTLKEFQGYIRGLEIIGKSGKILWPMTIKEREEYIISIMKREINGEITQ